MLLWANIFYKSKNPMKKKIQILAIFLSILGLNACHYLSFARIKVQQGNLLEPKTIQKLKIGMLKTDVAIVLGSSLVPSVFQKDRWDYAYTFQKNEGIVKTKHLSLYFHNEKLIKISQEPST